MAGVRIQVVLKCTQVPLGPPEAKYTQLSKCQVLLIFPFWFTMATRPWAFQECLFLCIQLDIPSHLSMSVAKHVSTSVLYLQSTVHKSDAWFLPVVAVGRVGKESAVL